MSLNKTMLTGRLTSDPNLTYTRDNKAVARASIAVNRNYKNSNGDRPSDFFDLVVWNKYGENFAEWAKKGDLISVVARAENNNYEKDGVRHSRVSFRVEEWEILESRSTRNSRHQTPDANNFGESSNSGSIPDFGRNYAPNYPNYPSSPMDIADDDLPF